MAFGRPRVIDADSAEIFTAPPTGVLTAADDGYAALLESNIIWTPAVAIFRREVLDELGAFDARVNAAADYDLYLRVARHHPIAGHGEVVADYRHHRMAMSRNAAMMLRTTLTVHRRQWRHARGDGALRRSYREVGGSGSDSSGTSWLTRFARNSRAATSGRAFRACSRWRGDRRDSPGMPADGRGMPPARGRGC